MRILFIWFLAATFACAASGSSSVHEESARRFFSKLITRMKDKKISEIITLLHEKANHFLPGMITDADAKEFSSAVDAYYEEKPIDGQFNVPSTVSERLNKEYQKRLEKLNTGSKDFLSNIKGFEPSMESVGNLGNFTKMVDQLTSQFNHLGSHFQSQLKEQFPIFTKLDEVRAHATVFDRIWNNLKGLCQDLPQVDECDQILMISMMPKA